MNCPRCSKTMDQESQDHSIKGISSHYNYEKKEFLIPKTVELEFTKKYWCKNVGCNMRDKYIYIDGNYQYELKELNDHT